jgi:8-oxo-dGTP pyrophosphatase MutT (NUDIX family)
MNASCVSLVKYIPPNNLTKYDQTNIHYTIELHNRYLCTWNTRYGFWTLPGGKQEPNETLEECLMRKKSHET